MHHCRLEEAHGSCFLSRIGLRGKKVWSQDLWVAPAGVRGGEDLVWGQARWKGSLLSEVLSSLSVVMLKSFMAGIRWNFVVVFLILVRGTPGFQTVIA